MEDIEKQLCYKLKHAGNNPLDTTRFGESLRIVQDNLDSKNFYAFNPAFDK